MSNKAPYSKTGLLILFAGLIAFAALGVAYIAFGGNAGPAGEPMVVAATINPEAVPDAAKNQPVVSPEIAPATAPAPVEAAEPTAQAPQNAEPQAGDAALINLDAAKGTRSLGDPNAPVKIVEYSSLTCSHCGHFHKEILGKIKEAYIDTGKVYLEFVDFPLNAPALQASQVARCLPAERYYPFVQLLFETQEKWAYADDYMKYLKQNAQLAGLSEEQFDACVANKDLQKFIADRMEAAQKDKKVNSTPTFIIDGETTITGARPFEDFAKAIDAVLEAKK